MLLLARRQDERLRVSDPLFLYCLIACIFCFACSMYIFPVELEALFLFPGLSEYRSEILGCRLIKKE